MKNIYHNDTKWDKEEFEKELVKGHKYQAIVRDKLIEAGLEVEMPSINFNKGTDDGDIFVFVKGQKYVLEVKSLSREFTCIEDFPYKTIIVDMEENFDKKKHHVTAYVYISQKTEAMFVISTTSKKYWTKEYKKDTKRGYTKNFIFAEKKYAIEFDVLVQWFKSQ